MQKGFKLLAVALFACLVSVSCLADGIFGSSYNASLVFQDALGGLGHPMGMAFDGSHYWAVTGGFSFSEAEYNPNGSLVNTFSPGLDFRSVFSDGGVVYARQFADSQIYQQTSPGSFSPFVNLSGGSLNDQSSVVLNSAGTQYIAQASGTVERWSLAGAFLGTTALIGYVDPGYPANRYRLGRRVLPDLFRKWSASSLGRHGQPGGNHNPELSWKQL
jgi:hypothetical protein